MNNLYKRVEHNFIQETSFQKNTFFQRLGKEFKRNKIGKMCFFILLVIILLALLAPLSPYNPYEMNASEKLQNISTIHWFGTDDFGRDYFTRTLYGGRISLIVGFGAMIVSILGGSFIGIIAGYIGGVLDKIVMQIINIFLAVPSLLLMVVLNSFFDPGLITLILIISLFSWPYVARIVRSETLSIKNRDYILASQNLGTGIFKIIFKHIIPNILGTIIVAASTTAASAILMESTLSFLGLGVQIPIASWGSMLQDSQRYIVKCPTLAIFPSLMIMLTVLSLNVIGDVIRNGMETKNNA